MDALWGFGGVNPYIYMMAQGPRGRIARPLLTIYRAYVASTGNILLGPAGWTSNKETDVAGHYTIDTGFDLTADGVAAWGWVAYTGSNNLFTGVAQIEYSAINPTEVQIWTPRARDGGEIDNNFFLFVAVGTADSVKKAILNDNGSFRTSPFNPPAGWTAARTGTGAYRVTPTGGLDLTPFAAEAAFCTMPYGKLNDTEPKQHTAWRPGAPTTDAVIETRRMLDGALVDRDSYMVWIDPSSHEIPLVGAELNGGTFIGGTPAGWSANNPTPGLTEVNIAQGNLPAFGPPDGLGIMINPDTGQPGNGAGASATFDGTPEMQVRTFRMLDGAATVNLNFYVHTLEGAAPT